MNLLDKWHLFNILVVGTGDRKIGGNMKFASREQRAYPMEKLLSEPFSSHSPASSVGRA